MPSFSIEAEGETVPLSVQDIYQTLVKTAGSSASNQSLHVSSRQLANWEKAPGYWSLLLEVYLDVSLDDAVRLQAIIQLKNGVDKYWRKHSTHPIHDDEKAKIRKRALESGWLESRQVLALQNALVVAKIIRTDFPQDWPDAVDTLVQCLDHARDAHVPLQTVSNILKIVLHTVKELASGRLIRSRKALQQVAPSLLIALLKLYAELVSRWENGMENAGIHMHLSRDTLKVIRRLLVTGFEHPHRDQAVRDAWRLLNTHHAQFLTLATANNGTELLKSDSMLVKHLFQLDKGFLEMSREHPASFVSLGCMDILRTSWHVINGNDAKRLWADKIDWSVQSNNDSTDEILPVEKLALRALLLIRACVKMVFNATQTFKYQSPEDKQDREAAVTKIKTEVLTEQFVVEIMQVLVNQYFVLRPSDLQQWEEEPDEWERREEEVADAWEFSVRSCAEKLFLDLLIHFKTLLVPPLLQAIRTYARLENTDLLMKDSLYSAIAISAAVIEDQFDINNFITETLVREIEYSGSKYNLLRRRTAMLLGQWVPIKPEYIDTKAVYHIFSRLLSESLVGNDYVVRLTAARQLKLVIEPFEFNMEDFRPYLGSNVRELISIITGSEAPETVLAVLETLRLVITKVESDINPFAKQIIEASSSQWALAGEELLIKQAILSLLTSMVTSLGKHGLPYHTILYPLLETSLIPDQEGVIFLFEEAMDLWQAILAQTPTADPPQLLLQLATKLPLLFSLGSDQLRACFEVVDSYAILSPMTILEPDLLNPLLKAQISLHDGLTTSKAHEAALGAKSLETLLQAIKLDETVAERRDEVLQYLFQALGKSGYLADLLSRLWCSYSDVFAKQVCKSNGLLTSVGETAIFNFFAHMCMTASKLFLDTIRSTGFPSPSSVAAPTDTNNISWILKLWLSTFDSISDTIRRKMQLLAITSLLGNCGSPFQFDYDTIHAIKDNLQTIFATATDVIIELADGAADENRGDYMYSDSGGDVPDYPETDTPEDVRKRRLTNNDVVYTINTRDFVKQQLEQFIELQGGYQNFKQYDLSRIDPEILKGFGDLNLL